MSVSRPPCSKARKAMKSDVKKSTGIAKRVTVLTDETTASLLKDIET